MNSQLSPEKTILSNLEVITNGIDPEPHPALSAMMAPGV